jgi:hypothetical protein
MVKTAQGVDVIVTLYVRGVVRAVPPTTISLPFTVKKFPSAPPGAIVPTHVLGATVQVAIFVPGATGTVNEFCPLG